MAPYNFTSGRDCVKPLRWLCKATPAIPLLIGDGDDPLAAILTPDNVPSSSLLLSSLELSDTQVYEP